MKKSFKLLAALSAVAAFTSAASAATINLTPESPTYLYYGLQGVDNTPTVDPNAVITLPAIWNNADGGSIYEADLASGAQGFVQYTFHSDTPVQSLQIHGRNSVFFSGISWTGISVDGGTNNLIPGSWASVADSQDPLTFSDVIWDSTVDVGGGHDFVITFSLFHGSAESGYGGRYGSIQALRTGTSIEKQDGRFEVTVVPEPATWVLLALGGTFLMVIRRRRVA